MSLTRYSIRWTSTISEHLEIDRNRKLLFLYQHPSLQWLLHKETPAKLTGNLYSQEHRERRERDTPSSRPNEDYAWREASLVRRLGINNFYADLLRSYQVLFASDPMPWFSWLLGYQPRALEFPAGDCDPLLRQLCSSSPVPEHFSIATVEGSQIDLFDFPFLGKRLALIAEIGQGNNVPYILWKVWCDRFNPNGWTVKWVILMLGVVALLLQLAQTIASVIK